MHIMEADKNGESSVAQHDDRFWLSIQPARERTWEFGIKMNRSMRRSMTKAHNRRPFCSLIRLCLIQLKHSEHAHLLCASLSRSRFLLRKWIIRYQHIFNSHWLCEKTSVIGGIWFALLCFALEFPPRLAFCLLLFGIKTYQNQKGHHYLYIVPDKTTHASVKITIKKPNLNVTNHLFVCLISLS